MAYQLSDLRQRVRGKLKDTSFNQTYVDDALNDAQLEIAGLFPWKHLEKIVSGALTVNEYTFEQQDDHQITTRLVLVHPTIDTSSFDISKNYLNPDDFFDRFPVPDAYASGRPYHWTEYGDQIYFDKPSDLAYLLRQYYNRLPVDMTADADVPDFTRDFREALVLGAWYRCEQQRRNFDYSALIERQFQDKIEDLITKLANRQMAVPEVVINGVQHNDWDY